ncbi:polysaccharide biosynthesis protein [Oceanobacillus piezotolerans]|uniref:Polysaccharide biosynthesis protein n=1 Tax=Oceanobacillus piezotolerans TaxID=2448030 RepID=A0A498DE68_9BACI|nr:polysaccharide biosynthesis protein [Oceanobacillus piezotolerans]RLL41679.1 polysaccharide biosynthesis protein [Oceanobacillus piezotolerans]
MDGNETNKLVKGALLLTLAGLLSKVLSAGYRIPLQNLTGDIGFYVYQQVYPIIGMSMMLALYGFPSAISKMVVDLDASGKKHSLQTFYLPILLILLIINGAFFLLLLLNAGWLASLVGDLNLIQTYQLSAYIFLMVPFLSLLRGVFQGNYEMKPTAFSQVGEQIIRVSIIIAAALIISIQGKSLYYIGEAASYASLAGGLIAFTILILYFIRRKPINWSRSEPIPWKYYFYNLFVLGMVATLNHTVLLVIQFADTFTFVPSLMDYGLTRLEAMEAKGVFDRGQPLIQLGIVLGSSFALALIPSISRKKLNENRAAFYQYIRSAFLFSFYLALGATLGLIGIFKETNILLFQDSKGTLPLSVLVLSIFFSSLAITASSILQGLGYIKRTAGFIFITFLMKILLNISLIPMFGMMGSVLATVISLMLLFILVMVELKRKLPGLKLVRQINPAAVCLASIFMLTYIGFMKYILPGALSISRMALLLYVLFIVFSGGIIFILTLIRGRAFTETELRLLPMAETLIRIHKGRKINE